MSEFVIAERLVAARAVLDVGADVGVEQRVDGPARRTSCEPDALRGVENPRQHHVEGGQNVQSWCRWDVLDVIRQAGFRPIAPSLGTEEM